MSAFMVGVPTWFENLENPSVVFVAGAGYRPSLGQAVARVEHFKPVWPVRSRI
jgi:hypothetical protein